MPPNLSIIIPCYNCERTLREAVESCYAQDLTLTEFEIIMVDDGSKDGTRLLMEQLATERSNITLHFHEVNKGGGAARNTGITAARGDLIYCLDSDNIFSDHSIKSMVKFLYENQIDGVAFYERRFFLGSNTNNFTTKINTVLGQNIDLKDLFSENEILLDNFIYKKSAYLRTRGYPENHGFDTQCFEIRYLAAGNTVQICPNSIFYHRQAMDEPSYFERVHNSGLFSINTIVILEEIFHLFNPQTQKELIDFPIFTNNKSYGLNIVDLIRKKIKNAEPVFISDYREYLLKGGRELWLDRNLAVKNSFTELIKVFVALDNTDYTKANSALVEYIRQTHTLTPYIQFLNLRIMHLLAGVSPAKCITVTLENVKNLLVTPVNSRGGKVWLFLRRNYYLQQLVRVIKKYS